MFFISFLGCCGALNKVKSLLGIYSFILLIVLLSHVALIVSIGVYSTNLKDILTPFFRGSIRKHYMGDMRNKSLSSIAWDAVMFNLECCGVSNYSDFSSTENDWKQNENLITPRACCKVRTI